MDNIGRNYNIPSHQKAEEAARNIGEDILVSTSGSSRVSEAGNIGKNFRSVLGKWSDKLHSALQKWSDDEGQLENLISKAKTVVSEYQLFWGYYEQRKKDGQDEIFPPGYITKLKSVMNMLGVPPSLVNTGSLITAAGNHQGWYALSASDMLQDCQLIAKYAAKDYANYVGQFGNPQQAVTRDMLLVMYSVTSLQTNEKSMASIFANLKNVAQQITQNVT